MRTLHCGCGECDQKSIALIRNPLAKPLGLGEEEDPDDYLYVEHMMLTGGRRCPGSGKIPDGFQFAIAAVTVWPLLAEAKHQQAA
ncbi:MAG: hypothetical protein AAB519_02120 [Patescibacteria group bacterium]